MPAASDGGRKPPADTLVSAVSEAHEATLSQFKDKGLKPDELAICVRRMDRAKGTFEQADVNGDERMYPASVVKLFYLVRLANALHDNQIAMTPELQRAAQDMIVDSVNDATSLVLDTLTGTTSGPEMGPRSLASWSKKRNVVNRWYQGHKFLDINVCQKPWNEGPYGRERQFLGPNYENRNALTPKACVRLMSDIATDKAVPLEAEGPSDARFNDWMKGLLSRKTVADGGDNEQSKLFSGSVLPKGTLLWSKAGWTDTVRHDVAWFKLPNGHEYVWAIFTKGHSDIPAVQFTAGELLKRLEH